MRDIRRTRQGHPSMSDVASSGLPRSRGIDDAIGVQMTTDTLNKVQDDEP